jgi:hypothetical protein
MKKIVKIKESDLLRLINKRLTEQRDTENYMFFGNLEQMKRQIDDLMRLDRQMVDNMLQNGHDWADDHISKAKENIDHVYEFMMNELDSPQDMMEAKKKKKKRDTKLCARGIAAAKAKYDVYPSAYANGYAVQVCKGTQPGNDGVKRCSGSYC